MAGDEGRRNLLLGIVAREAGLVDDAQLLAAWDRWLQEPQKAFADILSEHGGLSAQQRQELLELAERRSSALPDEAPQTIAYEAPDKESDDELTRHEATPANLSTLVGLPPAVGEGYSGAAPDATHRYQVLRPHARGGLGEVYIAQDTELGREVALKQMQPHHADNRESRSRFVNEAVITGRLEHPGIVPVYGLGTYADGKPFYAMRFVRGESLRAAIQRFHSATDAGQRSLQLRKLIGRLIQACNAIEYAHRRGVLHRDLKPGNIMLGQFGETLVVDWGLARMMSDLSAQREAPNELSLIQAARPAELTLDGRAVGTPQYMSPEQAEGRLDLLSPATDVYGLGATLYAILTNSPPYPPGELEEVLQRVRQGDFRRPRQIDPRIPVPLEAICLKAMAYRPEERYASAEALAEDLERWLADEPISARTEPWPERLARWTRRHKQGVRVALAALLVVAVVSIVAARQVWKQHQIAEQERQDRLLAGVRAAAAERTAAAERRAASAAKEAADTHRFYALLNSVRERNVRQPAGWTWQGLDDLSKAAALEPPDASGPSLRSLAAQCLSGVDWRVRAELAPGMHVGALATSYDGRLLAIGQSKAQAWVIWKVMVYDLQTQSVLHEFHSIASLLGPKSFDGQDGTRSLAFSRDGRYLAMGTRRGYVYRWDLQNKDAPALMFSASESAIVQVGFSADGKHLFTCSDDNVLKRWELADTPRETATLTDVFHFDLNPRGDLLSCVQSNTVALVAPDTLAQSKPPLNVDAGRATFHPRAEVLTVGSAKHIQQYCLDDGSVSKVMVDPLLDKASESGIVQQVCSPDGSLLAVLADNQLRLWSMSSGELLATYAVPDAVSVAFAQQGQSIVVSMGRQTTLLELQSASPQRTAAFEPRPILSMDWLPASLSPRGDPESAAGLICLIASRASWWDPEGQRRKLEFRAQPDPDSPQLTAGTAGVALIDTAGHIRHQRFNNDAVRSTGDVHITVQHLALSPDAKYLWGVHGETETCVWDAKTLEPIDQVDDDLIRVLRGTNGIECIVARGNGALAGGTDGGLRRFLLEGPTLTQSHWPVCNTRLTAVAMREETAVCGSQAGEVFVVAMDDGKVLATLQGHNDMIQSVSLSSGNAYLATASRDRTVRLWQRDANGFTELCTLNFPKPVVRVAFHPQRPLLAVLVHGEMAVRLWNVEKLQAQFKQLKL